MIIRNTNKVNRSIDFDGLNKVPGKRDSVYASDIDSIMEFDDKHLIMIEMKEEGKELPVGQRLLLQRIADRWGEGAIALYVTHDPSLLGDIPVTELSVSKVYTPKSGWVDYKKNLLSFLHSYANKHNIYKLKKR